MKKIFLLCLLVVPFLSFGQQTFEPGEIVPLVFNHGGSDNFAWMPLVDIKPGTEIKLSDKGYDIRNNDLVAGESVVTFTAPNLIPAGTILKWNTSAVGTDGHSGVIYITNNQYSGDQLSIFTGDPNNNPDMIFILHNGGWYNTAVSSDASDRYQNSHLPTGLSDGQTAIRSRRSGSNVSFYYNGSTSATSASNWDDRITKSSAWSTSTSQRSLPSADSYEFVGADISAAATGDWTATATWTGAVVPFSENSVTVASGQTITVDDDVACNNLTIDAGGSVVISADKSLYVKGTITNSAGNSGIILESSADGTGKIVTNTSGVSATVRQYITGGPRAGGGNFWHYMSLPVSGTPNVETIFNDIFVMKNVEANITESNTGWEFLQAGETLETAIGYGIWAETNTTIEYTGTLNTGDITVNLSYAGSGTNAGYNLVGNPYASTLNWDNVTINGADNAIYLFNPTSETYVSYVNGAESGQTREIPPMQAFFVRASAAGQSIVFENDTKTALGVAFKSAVIESILKLKVECGDRSDITTIRGHSNANDQFNGDLDAYKLLAAASKTPQIYSTIDDVNYSINSISQISQDVVIPISVFTNQNEMHSLSLGEMKELDYQHVYIRNLSNDQVADLKQGDYTFLGSENSTFEFELSFVNSENKKALLDNSFIVFTNERKICIENLENQSLIKVININGQVIKELASSDDRVEIPVIASGVYIVQVVEAGKLSTRKIVVN